MSAAALGAGVHKMLLSKIIKCKRKVVHIDLGRMNIKFYFCTVCAQIHKVADKSTETTFYSPWLLDITPKCQSTFKCDFTIQAFR